MQILSSTDGYFGFDFNEADNPVFPYLYFPKAVGSIVGSFFSIRIRFNPPTVILRSDIILSSFVWCAIVLNKFISCFTPNDIPTRQVECFPVFKTYFPIPPKHLSPPCIFFYVNKHIIVSRTIIYFYNSRSCRCLPK